jgi:hypothetical protein
MLNIDTHLNIALNPHPWGTPTPRGNVIFGGDCPTEAQRRTGPFQYRGVISCAGRETAVATARQKVTGCKLGVEVPHRYKATVLLCLLLRHGLKMVNEGIDSPDRKPQSPSPQINRANLASNRFVATESRLRRPFVAAGSMVLSKFIVRPRQSFSDGGLGNSNRSIASMNRYYIRDSQRILGAAFRLVYALIDKLFRCRLLRKPTYQSALHLFCPGHREPSTWLQFDVYAKSPVFSVERLL